MTEQELLPASYFRLWPVFRSLHGCKRVERNLLRYYAKHDRWMYNNLRRKPGFESKDYFNRGE